jgi:hypothetical protein
VEVADEVADVSEGEQKDQLHSKHRSQHSIGAGGDSAQQNASQPLGVASGRPSASASGSGSKSTQAQGQAAGAANTPGADGGDCSSSANVNDDTAAEAAGTKVYAAGSSASSEYDNPNVRDHDDTEGEEENADSDRGSGGRHHAGGWDRHMTLSIEGMVRDELKWLKNDGYLAGHASFHPVRTTHGAPLQLRTHLRPWRSVTRLAFALMLKFLFSVACLVGCLMQLKCAPSKCSLPPPLQFACSPFAPLWQCSHAVELPSGVRHRLPFI